MENSFAYQGYKKIKQIYLCSNVVNISAMLLSKAFSILVESKAFLIASHPMHRAMFESSVMYSICCRLAGMLRRILGMAIFKKSVGDSFFAVFFVNALEKKNKAAISQIYLILIVTLLVNMGIKVFAGNFYFIVNKQLIIALFMLIGLYYMHIDYWTILKNSKVMKLALEILNDESAKHDNDI